MAYLLQDATLRSVYALAQRFVGMVTRQSAEPFAAWVHACQESGVVLLDRFAQRLLLDRRAVEGALAHRWSNGQVEGQINRLKFIKRQMYGRASFALLRKRVLYRSEE